MKKYFFSGSLPVFIICIFSMGCGSKKIKTTYETPPVSSVTETNDSTRQKAFSEPVRAIASQDTLIKIGKTPVWVLSPEGKIRADILVLPGWNFPKEKICKESDFCTKALQRGYRLVLPEMIKSVYATAYFPETKPEYKKYLTLTWVTDTMIPTLQETYQIFKGSENYIHGISTGARGGALVHLNTGGLFTKVALLSGDYNNARMTDDNLLTNTYGPYKDFEERWTMTDNPQQQSGKWSARLYIAHGMKDQVVDPNQSIGFADNILLHDSTQKITRCYPENAGHDFMFWGGETEAILDFFDKE